MYIHIIFINNNNNNNKKLYIVSISLGNAIEGLCYVHEKVKRHSFTSDPVKVSWTARSKTRPM